MTDNQSVLNKLIAFKQRNKFSATEWKSRGLNPSDNEVCQMLEASFNNCADNLYEAVKANFSNSKLKAVLKKSLNTFNEYNYDTEEREFIFDYFIELSGIVNVDFKSHLNRWLYGVILTTVLKGITFFRGNEKILQTLSQACTACNTNLETFILGKEKNIDSDSWHIIQCNSCKEYNILSMGAEVKLYRIGNYKLVEDLSKADYTEEQANVRLEQIKYFRKQ